MSQTIPNIKSFEDACQSLGIDPTILPDVSLLPEKTGAALIAQYKLWVIVEALNEGWKPDWTDRSQWKYYPWFRMSSGSSASCHDFDDVYSYSIVGSRLAFKSAELARYAGEQFAELYNLTMVL